MFTRNQKFLALTLATSIFCIPSQASVNPEYIARQEQKRAAKFAREVPIYGYPLVMMNLLKQYGTYSESSSDYKAPINQLAHAKRQPTPLETYSYPSIDSLSSDAWIDLTKGPLVFHVPDVFKRYYLFEIFDGWTNILETISSVTTDSKAKDFLICGPNYRGLIPRNMTQVSCKTNMAYIKGFTQCFGPDDYKNVHTIQEGITLTPLASIGQGYYPPGIVSLKGEPIATKEPPSDQVCNMSFIRYFNTLSTLLKTNPPSTHDVRICKTMQAIGIDTGQKFDAESINRTCENGLQDAFHISNDLIDNNYCCVYTQRNHWKMIVRKETDLGTDYLRRAFLARADLPTSLSQNLLNVTTNTDHEGFRLTGLCQYRMHITKEQLPPVLAFWSLTLYTEGKVLSLNPINKYAIQSFADSLKYNEDGSCDIFIQHLPADPCYNWLPCPRGNFNLILRLYQPQDKVLDGEWMPPSIKCLNPI